MTTIRRTPVLGLTLLLVAAAAADVVITADEVVHCRDVRPAGSDSVCFTLPGPELRTLSALDVYEVRLPDSSRVAALSERLPQLRVVLDAGQPVLAPAVRAREMLALRGDLSRRPTEHVGILDTLYLPTTPGKMMAMCGEMDILLRKYERNDTAVVSLLREVRNEQAALRRIWPQTATCLVYGPIGGLLGGCIGGAIGSARDEVVQGGCGTDFAGSGPGALLGCVAGSAVGMAIGTGWRENLLKRHRNRVNDLIRRVNLAVVTAP